MSEPTLDEVWSDLANAQKAWRSAVFELRERDPAELRDALDRALKDITYRRYALHALNFMPQKLGMEAIDLVIRDALEYGDSPMTIEVLQKMDREVVVEEISRQSFGELDSLNEWRCWSLVHLLDLFGLHGRLQEFETFLRASDDIEVLDVADHAASILLKKAAVENEL